MMRCRDVTSCPCAEKFVSNVGKLLQCLKDEISPFEKKKLLDAAEHIFEPESFKVIEEFVGSHMRSLLTGTKTQEEVFERLMAEFHRFAEEPEEQQQIGKKFTAGSREFLDLNTGNVVRNKLGARIS